MASSPPGDRPPARAGLGLPGSFLLGAVLLLLVGLAGRALHQRLAAPVTVRVLYTGDDRGFLVPCG